MRSWGCLVLLIPLTLVTVIPLIGVVWMYISCTIGRGEELFPKTANIGLVFLVMALALNVPTSLLWCIYFFAEKPIHSDEQNATE